MSLQTFLTTVENDIKSEVKVLEGDAINALTFIWGVTKPIFTSFEPQLVQALMTELASFLGGAADDVKNGDASYIATVFLATLRDTGHTLLTIAESLGENLLTVLAGLAKNAAKA